MHNSKRDLINIRLSGGERDIPKVIRIFYITAWMMDDLSCNITKSPGMEGRGAKRGQTDTTQYKRRIQVKTKANTCAHSRLGKS